MKKLVHFITSLETGGAQAILYNLVVSLQSSYAHHIIFIHDGPYRERFQQLHIPVYQISGAIFTYNPTIFYQLVTLLKQLNPDCLHTILWSANWLGCIAARILNIPCVNAFHNNRDQNGIVRNLLDRCTPKPQCAAAVSHEVKKSHQYFLRNQVPISVVPNGIDIDLLQNRITRSRITRASFGYTDDHIVIGSVGRFHPIKRYPFLLESFAKLVPHNTHVRLMIVGTGDEATQLQKIAHKLTIAHLVTFVINQPAQDYYSLFDWFVLCSEKEGISIALLEAMGLGIPPIVTYHSPTHPVIKQGQSGVVAYPHNATEFAHLLKSLVDNKNLRFSLGRNARETVRVHFTHTAMVQAYDHIFGNCTYDANT